MNTVCSLSLFFFLLFFFFPIDVHFLRKLAKKRKETLSSTRQEMTVMVNSMDKSYTEQGTNCDEAFSFMDTHNLNGRCKFKMLGDAEISFIFEQGRRVQMVLKIPIQSLPNQFCGQVIHSWKIYGIWSLPLCSTLQHVF